MIRYAQPSITRGDQEAVARALSSSMLTQGPLIEEFEEKVAEYTGAQHCIAVSSGTAALDAVCGYLYRGETDVWVPAITFIATADAVRRAGCKVHLNDIDMSDYMSHDADDVIVEMAGRPFKEREDDLLSGLRDIDFYDSSHSFNRNMCRGTHTLSFHAIKNITTAGEGGAVITNEADLAEYVREYRNHGIKNGDYVHEGGNHRMTCAQAAMGISQLKRANEFKEKKEALVLRYSRLLEGVGDLILPQFEEDVFWHLYIIRTEKRDDLKVHLEFGKHIAHGVYESDMETQIHYKPLYHYTRYRGGNCPNAEEYGETALSIPLYADLTYEEQDYIVEKIKEFYR